MARLIGADALMKRMCERCNEAMEDQPCEPSECFVREIIASIPTIEAEPVRHGRWEECDYVKYDGHGECIHYPKAALRCSCCCNAFKKELLWKRNYCPNCGARMDEEA